MALAWNPADKSPNITLSNANTTATQTAGGYYGVRGDVGHGAGTYYFEAIVPASANEGSIGLANASASLSAPLGYGSRDGVGLYEDGTLWAEWNAYSASVAQYYSAVRVGILANLTTRRLWMRGPTGAWIFGGNPASGGAGIDLSHITGALFPMMVGYGAGNTSTL